MALLDEPNNAKVRARYNVLASNSIHNHGGQIFEQIHWNQFFSGMMLSISKLTSIKNINEIIYVVCRSRKPFFYFLFFQISEDLNY